MTGLVLALLQPETAPPPPPATGGYGLFVLETLLILAGICLLAWFVVRFGVRRLYAPIGAGAAGGPLRVVARLPLEPRRTLYIVEAGGKTLLVGAAESGPLSVLAELDGAAVDAALRAQPKPRSFLEVMNLKKKESGE